MFQVEYLESVKQRDAVVLPKSEKQTIQRAIEERLRYDPVGLGKPLQRELKGYYRLRVGHYRIIYRIDHTTKIVLITAIEHRKDVYTFH